VYPGPIGAILTPQLLGMHDKNANTLPFASTLCGACYDACPVKINIPEVLIYLRSKVREQKGPDLESTAMAGMAWFMTDGGRFELALRLARLGQGPFVKDGAIHRLPGMLGGWTNSRDLPAFPKQSFRDWWKTRGTPSG
jgi:L-lactate dehydrogenase complex protein LldF